MSFLCEVCNQVTPIASCCLNPECVMLATPPREPRPGDCSCGEMYEGRPCAPNCEAVQYQDELRDRRRNG